MKIDILMDKNKTIKACFWKKKFTLNTEVDPADGGTITPKSGKHDKGTVVTVEAIPAEDYEFNHWEGDVSSKWFGLEMNYENIHETDANMNLHFDQLVAGGFTQIRLYQPDWMNSSDIAKTKAIALVAMAKGLKVLIGLTSDETKLTAANWSGYVTAIESLAAWAQANGIYEFILGNHLEFYNDNTTLTKVQLRANIRTLATSVQAIFTNGEVSYSNSCVFLADWLTEGIGDLDTVGWMIYGDESWQSNIDSIVATFGIDHAYIIEWNIDAGGYQNTSTDEVVQATLVTKMIDYFKASGITRAFFYVYTQFLGGEGFEVLKTDGNYRLLWNSLLNSE